MKKNKKVEIKDMTSFNDLHNKMMKNATFKKAYDALEPEYMIIRQIIKQRIHLKMSQKDLAKRLGTKQSAVSRLESDTYNPTLSFLKKLSKALDSDLVISFK